MPRSCCCLLILSCKERILSVRVLISMEILKNLHTSVAQAFEVSVDNAYKQLNTELARRDARIKAAEDEAAASNEARINAATKSEELEHENSTLKEALHRHQADSMKGLDVPATKSHEMWEAYAPERVLGSCSATEMDNLHPDLLHVRESVDTKYRALYGEVQTLIKVSQELRMQVKRHKKKLIEWRDCLNRNEFTLVLDGFPVTFQKLQATANGHRMQLRTSNPSPSLIGPLETSGYTTTAGTSMPKPGLRQFTPESRCQGSSTQSDEEHFHRLSEATPTLVDCPLEYNEVDCNLPIGQVARPPKRKRLSSPQHFITSSSHHSRAKDKPERPITVKGEPISSSPLRDLSHSCGPNQPGRQNLDEIGDNVETSAKRKENNPDKKHQIPITTTTRSRLDDGLGGPHWNSCRSSPGRQVPRSLQPGGGRPCNDNNFDQQSNEESNRRLERVAQQGLPSVAEDGDDSYFDIGSRNRQQNSPSNTSMQQPGASTSSILAQRRLENLLETPTSPRLLLDLPRKLLDGTADGRKQLRNPHGPVNEDRAATNGKSALKLPRLMEKHRTRDDLADRCDAGLDDFKDNLTEPSPEDEPYRARPLHRLGLKHFKINPRNNDGLDFAFNEVARKKDAGCTRDDCCGNKFRAMARLGGVPAEPRRSHQEDAGDIEDKSEDGQQLLGVGEGEAEDGLLPGTRLIANYYGKHRHDHQRARTPPGFWRTEMPDTQDLERDREEARRQEREKVKERFREARRPGGLWKYADE